MAVDLHDILAGVRLRHPRALARAISIAESGGPLCAALLAGLGPAGPGTFRVGLTGPPGAGKSTLASCLARRARHEGRTVAVIAVDPSSERTGGALLGDRTRMSEHTLDPGVFIRSMAARGHPGGLAAATEVAARVLDAAGFGLLVVEGVGSGQLDSGVTAVCDTTVLVTTPSGGDVVQAMKAGIMEVADVIVVNQCDRPGAAAAVAGLRSALALGDGAQPVLEVSATGDVGVGALWAHLAAAQDAPVPGGREARRRAGRAAHLRRVALGELRSRLAALPEEEVERLAEAVTRGEQEPGAAAVRLMRAAAEGDPA